MFFPLETRCHCLQVCEKVGVVTRKRGQIVSTNRPWKRTCLQMSIQLASLPPPLKVVFVTHWKHCLTKHRDGPRVRSFWKWSKIPKVERIGLEATLLRKKFLLSLLPGIRLTCKCFDDSSMWAWNPLILVGILAFVENSRSRYVVSLKKRTLFYVELTQPSIALWIGHCTMYVLCSVLF